MNRSEYELIEVLDNVEESIICAEDLKPHLKNRTLLYGYTCDRATFHVYLKDGKIHIVVYFNDYSSGVVKPKDMFEVIATSNKDFVPDKRLYPEACDYHFCKLLKLRNIHLPFTTWNENRAEQDYYGFTL